MAYTIGFVLSLDWRRQISNDLLCFAHFHAAATFFSFFFKNKIGNEGKADIPMNFLEGVKLLNRLLQFMGVVLSLRSTCIKTNP